MPPTAHTHQRNGYAAPDEAGFFAPRLGPEGEQCGACGAPLAADQRYCLACGERRAATRVPFPIAASPAAPVVAAAIVPPRTGAATVAATAPPAATPDPAAMVARATFAPDWPADTDG